MVTFGAAPLIVSAFRRVRRSRFTDAFQTCDPRHAGVHQLAEAVHGTEPSDVLTRIKRERVPTFLERFLDRSGADGLPKPTARVAGRIVYDESERSMEEESQRLSAAGL
jgi:hypothetical protein